MVHELPDVPETLDEQQRRFHGKRAGKPGEGFVDVRIISSPVEEEILTLGQKLAKLSKRRARELGYADNPEQFLLRCPKCDLMNDFTIDGRQIFYFAREFSVDAVPDVSTTDKRITVRSWKGDSVQCCCGNCGTGFEPQVE